MISAAHPQAGRRGLAAAGLPSQLSVRPRSQDAGRPQATGCRQGARGGSAAAFRTAGSVGPPGRLRARCGVTALSDFCDRKVPSGAGADDSWPLGDAAACLLLWQVLAAATVTDLLHCLPVAVVRLVVVPQVRGSSVPPAGTLWRFQSPQPPPRGGGIAGVVHLPTGPTGGATFALPLALQLGDCDQVRLKRRQPRPRGRLANVLHLPLGAVADGTVGHADLSGIDGGGNNRIVGSGKARVADLGVTFSEFCP
jgi:hypothetical protein